jgi:hypothetical protein
MKGDAPGPYDPVIRVMDPESALIASAMLACARAVSSPSRQDLRGVHVKCPQWGS